MAVAGEHLTTSLGRRAARSRATRFLLGSPLAGAAALVVAAHLVLAVFGPLIAPYGYADFHMMSPLHHPSWAFLGGTDQFGRDQLSRIIFGARNTVLTATASAFLGVSLGASLGMFAALSGPLIGRLVTRVLDGLMALPSMLLAMLILTTLGPQPFYVIATITIVFVPRSARVIRGAALSLAATDFIAAAKLRSESILYVIFVEMLPNIKSLVAVEFGIRFAYAILLSTSLGYLGLGAQPPAADWGLMLSEALPFLYQAPWLAVVPAMAIVSLVLAVNILVNLVQSERDGA